MATGFRAYADTPGNELITDMTDRISQNMGWVDTNGTNGSLVVPDAPNGRTFFHYVVGIAANPTADGMRPGVTITDNGDTVTLNWRYSYNGGFGRYSLNCRIHYGYY